MEWKLGGSGYKSMTKSVEPQTENEEMLRLVASKEVPNKKDVEQYALEMALKIDEKKSHNMENAPFKTVKKAELDESAKEKTRVMARNMDREVISQMRHARAIKDQWVSFIQIELGEYNYLQF